VDSPVEATAEFIPPQTVVGGHVIYRVGVTALEESFEAPDQPPAPAGLTLEPGGRGQNYEPTGGNKVRPRTFFIYHAVAQSNGTFTVPVFKATAYGKPVEIPAATLTVSSPGESPPPKPPLLAVTTPKSDVYVGELVTVPLMLVQEPPHTMPLLSEPKIRGDFIFSEQFVSGAHAENVMRAGAAVPAYIEDVSFIPLREGPRNLVAQAFTYMQQPIPGQPGASRLENSLIDSEPFVIDVKPLPETGLLPGFMGAVGRYRVDPPMLSTNAVRAGEPLSLVVTIRGNGNIGRITAPPAPADKNWQTFPPRSEDLAPGIAQQIGSIEFTYTMIPLNDGVAETPAIPFSAFDPELKKYVDLTVPPVPLTVKPSPFAAGSQTASSPAQISANQPGNSDDEKDLVMAGLARQPGLPAGNLVAWQNRWSFLLFQLVPAAALGGLWIWDRRRRFLREHPEVVLKRRARLGLRREWRRARRAAEARDAAGFAQGAAGALREACAPHGAANPSALVCADVLKELPPDEQRGAGAEMVRRLFSAADALSFGGAENRPDDLLSLRPELERILEGLKARL